MNCLSNKNLNFLILIWQSIKIVVKLRLLGNGSAGTLPNLTQHIRRHAMNEYHNRIPKGDTMHIPNQRRYMSELEKNRNESIKTKRQIAVAMARIVRTNKGVRDTFRWFKTYRTEFNSET